MPRYKMGQSKTRRVCGTDETDGENDNPSVGYADNSHTQGNLEMSESGIQRLPK